MKCSTTKVSLKSDMFSMVWPVFALDGKSKDALDFEYKGVSIKIVPSVMGRATVKDKEILVYCLSHIMAMKNAGIPPSNTVYFTTYEILKATGRGTSGKEYKLIEKALYRLAGTLITTDYQFNGRKIPESMGLIENFKLFDNHGLNGWQITLPEWLIEVIDDNEVLTLHPDYFLLKNPFERRLYEVCRKRCGKQPKHEIKLDNLKKRIGIRLSIPALKARLIKTKRILDYRLRVESDNLLIFFDSEHGRKQLAAYDIRLISK
ncbi:replication initiator protein A [Catenovulum sp. 2E275]|uniref:replication initiator protein A n=1 Tax=Catenovulum sp. 2E275 TaxID=2980497 RepID=UPI0021D0D9FB|nr:replication initiator protein A [Catenovulum sp. 2E275]MCU4676399.1 replication initiator protein A [Catenovulum sp. 2E275]